MFVSQKGMREALTGTNNDNSQWQAKPNDPALEGKYQRLMSSLALADARQASGQTGMSDAAMAAAAASGPSAATASSRAAQNVALAAQTPIKEDVIPEATSDEITLPEAYDRAWLRVGLGADRTNFTVDDRDRGRGIYFVRYVDPKDMTAAEQGFWNQVFHGKKEKLPKNYEVNVRALTETQTRVSIIDSKGNVDSSPQARQIMALLDDQLR